MKRTGGRRKSSQSDYPLKGKKTVEIIGEEFGDSAKQVQRYLKLTDLIPELLEKLDNGELSFNPAVELSYLTIEEQIYRCYGVYTGSPIHFPGTENKEIKPGEKADWNKNERDHG